MNTNITQLISQLSKPNKLFKKISLRFSADEFKELESYCKIHYLNYSDVLRAALKQHLSNN